MIKDNGSVAMCFYSDLDRNNQIMTVSEKKDQVKSTSSPSKDEPAAASEAENLDTNAITKQKSGDAASQRSTTKVVF